MKVDGLFHNILATIVSLPIFSQATHYLYFRFYFSLCLCMFCLNTYTCIHKYVGMYAKCIPVGSRDQKRASISWNQNYGWLKYFAYPQVSSIIFQNMSAVTSQSTLLVPKAIQQNFTISSFVRNTETKPHLNCFLHKNFCMALSKFI